MDYNIKGNEPKPVTFSDILLENFRVILPIKSHQ